MSSVWLRVKVSKGMFPDEHTVEVPAKPNTVVFCHKDFIKDDKMLVTVLEKKSHDWLVRLPVESPLGQLFWVSDGDVVRQTVEV